MKNIKIIPFKLLALMLFASCEGFLDEKPNKDLVVPSTITDLQGLLDATPNGMNNSPALGLLASDDIWTDDLGFAGYATDLQRNAYRWMGEVFDSPVISDWTFSYRQVFHSNIVLSEAKRISPNSEAERIALNQVIGSAYFYRSKAFYDLLEIFAPPFNKETASGQEGIILRLSPEIDQILQRASIQECYDKIIDDLKASVVLLPPLPSVRSRPSKAAAHALLARIYMAMDEYSQAETEATASLSLQSGLMDYNDLDPSLAFPFSVLNEEVIFHSQMLNYNFITNARTFIDTTLVKSYFETDLRPGLFFLQRGPSMMNFKGNYTGMNTSFTGLSTNEVYMMLAECRIRNGKVNEGISTLNSLLEKRHRTGEFVPYSGLLQQEALEIVLEERRKELVFRGLRWNDLRRLNKDPRFAKDLIREIEGELFTLPANSPRYVYPIPQEEIEFSGVTQNNRQD